ncbi:MAG TPA: biotin transporter BioY [Propionibacteriaceae bacterium]|nr:biotin transporter BioY [Propionibacteriaceae bacterium]
MRTRTATTDLALVAVFAALVAACTLVPAIPVGIGVPITLQTLGVMLAGLVLGPLRGFLAVLLYVVVGLAGLPVFAQGGAGLGTLVKPSAGYLLAFPLGALVTGAVAYWTRNLRVWRPLTLAASAIAGGILVVHPLGIVGLMVNAKLSFAKALTVDLIYLPGDLAKVAIAAAVGAVVHKAFPVLLATRPRREPVVSQ